MTTSPVPNLLCSDMEKYLVPLGPSGNSAGFTSKGRYVFFFLFPVAACAFRRARSLACVGGKASKTSDTGEVPVFSI